MKPIEVAIIGTGWCGGIRAETLAAHPLVKGLHLAEINAPRLAELGKKTRAKTAVADYKELLKKADIDAVYISATPETAIAWRRASTSFWKSPSRSSCRRRTN